MLKQEKKTKQVDPLIATAMIIAAWRAQENQSPNPLYQDPVADRFLDEDIKEKAKKALEDLGIGALADRQIGELSGGQQQRVFLARALVQEPDIFLLDEPFVGVDITTEEKIIENLKGLATAGKTLLVVHHDLSTVNDYFDRVILLNQRLIAYGDTEATFTEENIAKAYGAQLTILHKTGLIG